MQSQRPYVLHLQERRLETRGCLRRSIWAESTQGGRGRGRREREREKRSKVIRQLHTTEQLNKQLTIIERGWRSFLNPIGPQEVVNRWPVLLRSFVIISIGTDSASSDNSRGWLSESKSPSSSPSLGKWNKHNSTSTCNFMHSHTVWYYCRHVYMQVYSLQTLKIFRVTHNVKGSIMHALSQRLMHAHAIYVLSWGLALLSFHLFTCSYN